MKRNIPQTAVFASPGRRFVATLVLAHLLAVLALAASPRLHHWVHPDDDDDDHECAVTLFLHGGTDSAGPVFIELPVPPVEICTVLPIAEASAWVPSVFAASSIIEHAPPVVG